MKTTLFTVCVISTSAFAQYRSGVGGQLNNYRVGGGGEIVVLDKPIQGQVVSVLPVRGSQTQFIFRVRNAMGQDKEYLLLATDDIKKNGNLAHVEDIVASDWVSGYSTGDTTRVKNLILTTYVPPRVSKPKTNAPIVAKP